MSPGIELGMGRAGKEDEMIEKFGFLACRKRRE
jgi:hypothetical protein